MEGYSRLGLGGITETHREVGRLLGVPANTVKNMRDEFDPLHENPRAGWHQRKMPPSRVAVVRRFGDLDELELREIIQDLIGLRSDPSEGLAEVLLGLNEAEIQTPEEMKYGVTRQRTGRLAEEAFEAFHRTTKLPISGRLRDVRDQECGYDYLIEGEVTSCAIEVKGLSSSSGGILFTDREWRTAREYGERYVLAVVRSPEESPVVQLVKDPATSLQPHRLYELAVRVNYRVSGATLRKTRTNQ